MRSIGRQRLRDLAGKTGFAFADDIGIAGLLCAAAGFADAVGYVNSGVFAANMTGNTVLAALALAGGHWDVASQRGMTLGAFCVGVVLASFLLRLFRERKVLPLSAEVALILAAAFMEPSATLSIVLIATAMGVQAVTVTRFRSVVASTVVVTTTMARLAEFATAWMVARPQAQAAVAKTGPALLVVIWSCYGIGAILAEFAMSVTSRPLFFPAAMIAIVAILITFQQESR
ncbi:MAG: DUF1275 domain-containing protein [Hyphomicrobiales bacterium]|nr:DUF1275 domain-containing protein [Hyphomicrobiales bacterium]MBW0003455.1 DUF1275 domain-containing protein [Hyphomicrobiales bacterium]